MYHYRRPDRVWGLYHPSSIDGGTMFRSISIRIGPSLSMIGHICLPILLLISTNTITTCTTTNRQHTHTQSMLFPTVSSPTPPPHAPSPPHGSHSRQVSTSTRSSPGGIGSRNAVGGGLGMGSGVAGLPSTQAELGTAALRVGGSVLSGMRTLGGLAVSAARSRVAGSGSGAGGERSGSGNGSGVGRFFSRSAPEGVVTGGAWGRRREVEERQRESDRERWYSNSSSSPGTGGNSPAYRHHANSTSEGGYFVTVIDLAPLAGASHASSPTLVAEFMVSKDKQITRLAFSSDGCTLIIVPRDGHTLQTFQIRPVPPFAPFVDTPNDDTRAKRHSGIGPPARTSPPWHVYNLRRGRTSAVVEGVEWAGDGRWIAIGTRKRRTLSYSPRDFFGGGSEAYESILGVLARLIPLGTPALGCGGNGKDGNGW
ncbi:hypothetical protein Hypma_001642 [Hypsizygus marmoreus]|uniref:Uncharacterized protein n=1 Tax=Hypsizygus marmoreus TaxID=39966 RepID=A0A369JDE6_HYPMA|nr:hypothetical protein Hypma_001642 [Hypsizygus marmoreus]